MKKLITILLGACFVVLSCVDKKADKKIDDASIEAVKPDTIAKALGENKTITEAYFKANGTEPFWSLTISEKMIKLKTIADSILTPHTEPIYAQDSNVKRYTLHTELAKMNIQISQTECINAMSGMASPYSVTIEYMKGRDTEFTKLEGCGIYLTNYRLHDIWVLENLNGTAVSQGDFGKTLPSIEINSGKNTFFGTTGCNKIRGKLFSERDKLRFLNIASTKMMCLPDNKKEQEFIQALNNSVSYTIANNRLSLSNPDKMLMTFKKID
ncbi:META domain-containing protein [Aestuariivivens insulae]|uniref:META domain-containing protein n=1 Tax=Aestuariivivens insulae TaxID=1621988 RepID=UPI001F575F71|nr:META domain-containing protein [Aestuariivivens insulae]